MRALIITAVVIVLILAIGIPIIHYATKSDTATVSTKTLVTGQATKQKEEVKAAAPAAIPNAPDMPEPAPEASAKEVLEQYKRDAANNALPTAGPKTGYTIGYLVNQSKAQQGTTCKPLLDGAEKKLSDAEADVEDKLETYDSKRDRLHNLIDSDADENDIDDARDDVEDAKKAYETALAAKYSANDELVNARVQCASYLT